MVMRLGQVVTSKAGRDKGKWFIIVGFQDKWVLVADGSSRKVANPKRKNPKHLAVTNYVAEEIGTKLATGQKVYDRDLRSFLDSFTDGLSCQGGR
ncbi:MAG: RNA-binding protein [Bacillota bacterium]